MKFSRNVAGLFERVCDDGWAVNWASALRDDVRQGSFSSAIAGHGALSGVEEERQAISILVKALVFANTTGDPNWVLNDTIGKYYAQDCYLSISLKKFLGSANFS